MIDEIDRIERAKLRVFAVSAFIVFVVCMPWPQGSPPRGQCRGGAALLFSGAWGARRMTAEHNWAVLPAEGRLSGDVPSKRRVWAGNAYGEGKRMYVRPEARGKGMARHILNALEAEALALGCGCFMLETGPDQPDALAFYAKQGYARCGPFGDYPDHPLSVFMRKQALTGPR